MSISSSIQPSFSQNAATMAANLEALSWRLETKALSFRSMYLESTSRRGIWGEEGRGYMERTPRRGTWGGGGGAGHLGGVTWGGEVQQPAGIFTIPPTHTFYLSTLTTRKHDSLDPPLLTSAMMSVRTMDTHPLPPSHP